MITDQDRELIGLIDFITDRFFGTKVLPYMLLNAIKDYERDSHENQPNKTF